MLEIVSEAVWACEQFIPDNFIFRQNLVETRPILQALVYYTMLSFILGGMSLHWLNVVPQATVKSDNKVINNKSNVVIIYAYHSVEINLTARLVVPQCKVDIRYLFDVWISKEIKYNVFIVVYW